MIKLIDPPKKLVDEKGDVILGLFNKPVEFINGKEFVYFDESDKKVTGRKKLRKIHKFNFYGIINETWIIGFAVVDLNYLGNAFLYLYNRKDKKIYEYNYKSPFSKAISFSDYTGKGDISYINGRIRFVIKQDIVNKRRLVDISIPGLKLNFEMEDDYDKYQPLSISARNSYSGWTYTQKKVGSPVKEGILQFKNQSYDLKGSKLVFDWTNGYLRRDTYWLWAAATGHIGDMELGFNFSNGVNETSFTENGIWVDGKMVPVNGINIIYNRFNPNDKWKVFTNDGKVNLIFTPEGARHERINALVIKSNFYQFFGHYEGTIEYDGKKLEVSAVGFSEKHYAKW